MTRTLTELSPQVRQKVSQLRQRITGDDQSPPAVRTAWEEYLEVRQAMPIVNPIDQIEQSHIKAYVEAVRLERPIQTNSTLNSARFHLKLDTKGVGKPGILFEGLDEQQIQRAQVFVEKMNRILDSEE